MGAAVVHSLTHGEGRYHYAAPCRVESVSADGQTVVVSVEYPQPGNCRNLYNGERLRLDITEVWPPVYLLAARRNERRTALANPLPTSSESAACPCELQPSTHL